MSNAAPVIVWFRRDLRLADNPALLAAAAGGRPVICLFVLDAQAEAIGAAARWHLGQGLAALAGTLRHQGAQLILRRGEALEVLRTAVGETGAREVHWGRLYTPEEMARDRAVKAALRAEGVKPRAATPGHCWPNLGRWRRVPAEPIACTRLSGAPSRRRGWSRRRACRQSL
ncbi:deoxyribodipyrimidine photo-lyase [Phaeovulum sp.]|uniref:deoxyribodipyrimidine photo-lyase n=1 Tax=Phaeovulum sp. TaxID=2934796 RepID=UPI0030147AED